MIAETETQSQALHDTYVANMQGASQNLLEIAHSMRDPRFPGALIPADERLDSLFAASSGHLAWRRLAPLLEARIAYELSDLPTFIRSGPAPEALRDRMGGYSPFLWCPIRLAPGKLRKAAVSACARLVKNLYEDAALLEPPRIRRSVADLLSSFDEAINHDELDNAEALLLELREANAVDGLNLRFLLARLLGARGPEAATRLSTLAEELRGLRLPEHLQRLFERLSVNG
jgi:hypothetical protein